MPFLLERLAARPVTPGSRQAIFDETAAVAAQVQRILYSRNRVDGDAALVTWGLPNIVEIASHDMTALARHAEEIRRAILEHEPRLHNVSVNIVPQPNALTPASLLISGTLADSGEAWHLDLPFSD